MAAGCGTRPKAAKAENDLSKAERDALVVGGTVRGQPARGVMPLCRKLAADHARRVLADRGREFEVDDLEGEALAAAVEAARYYDPALGAFTTFAGEYVRMALLTATDERHRPPVYNWPTDRGEDGEAFEPADRAANDPDDLDHFDYLDADQRAAFDLIPDGAGKDIIRLVLRGYDKHQIEQQTGLPAKDVTLHVRNAVSALRKAGVVPAGLDPYPNEAAREAASWEREKTKNRKAADRAAEAERRAAERARRERERDARREARRQAKAREAEYLARLADRLRPLLAGGKRASNAPLADRLTAEGGAKVYAKDVGKAATRFELRPKRVKNFTDGNAGGGSI